MSAAEVNKKKNGAPSPAKNTAHPVTNTQVETRMTVNNTEGSVSSPNITSPTSGRKRPSVLCQLLDYGAAEPGALCTCGRPAQILVGDDRVKYCGQWDDDPHAHGTDEALKAALAEGHQEIVEFWARVPIATMAAALRGLADEHPDDKLWTKWAAAEHAALLAETNLAAATR